MNKFAIFSISVAVVACCGALYMAHGKYFGENNPVSKGTAFGGGASIIDGDAAIVNGVSVSEPSLAILMSTRQDLQQNRLGALDEVINMELLSQEARKNGLSKNPDVAAAIESYERMLLSRAAIVDHLDKNKVTDEDVKADYEKRTKDVAFKEYNLWYINSVNKDDVMAVVADLDAKNFDKAKLTMKRFMDGEKKSLDWVSVNNLPYMLANFISTMQKGGYNREPVQTRDGYFVFYVEDVRTGQPPNFDDVKGQIRAVMEAEKISAYVSEMRKKSDIKIK